jgi:translation initiation factor IF-2
MGSDKNKLRSKIKLTMNSGNRKANSEGDDTVKNFLKENKPILQSLKNNRINSDNRNIVKLDGGGVSQKREDNNNTDKVKTSSVYNILAMENKKNKEDEERRRNEIKIKEENKRKREEEKLREFNERIRKSRENKDDNVENKDNRGDNNSNDNNNNNRNNRDNRGGHRENHRENRDGNNVANGNKTPYKKYDGSKGGNKFITLAPVVIEEKRTKNSDDKKHYRDDYDEKEDKGEKKREGKKVVYISDDDISVVSKKRNKSFFKNKLKNDNVKDKVVKDIDIPESITVGDLSDRMGEKRVDVIKKLIGMGVMATVNQVIDGDTAELVVAEFGHNVKSRTTAHDSIDKIISDEGGKDFVSRSPVVTVMGHVDHGKTSLLDAIRTTDVAGGERGGITQHIGASSIDIGDGKFITFIDTPGHEAFTEMRMRGASITDIVVLVVAADDGVQNQTIEAISHVKSANVPIILAINKIDKQDANPKRVKEELLKYNVVAEEYGGDVMVVEVSAKNKIGLDKLKEAILLQSELLDLKSPIDVKSSGVVIESRMEQSRGVVATLLVQNGILREGDLVVTGISMGKIKKMVDDKGASQKQVGPSMAVEILGLDIVPVAGDAYNVVETDKKAREVVEYREKESLANRTSKRDVKSLDSMLKIVSGKSAKLLPVIVKADVNGSIEAITNILNKLNTTEVEVNVVHCATGAINATDVNLAAISNALIIAFNVRASNSIVELSKEKGVDVRYYSIVYDIVDDIKRILDGMIDPIIKEEVTGHAEIKQVFKVTGSGNVAGSFITDGEISRNDGVRLIRDGVVIYTGKIDALRRFKDNVKEVKQGFECGISIDGYNDIKEKDIIEGFRIVEQTIDTK